MVARRGEPEQARADQDPGRDERDDQRLAQQRRGQPTTEAIASKSATSANTEIPGRTSIALRIGDFQASPLSSRCRAIPATTRARLANRPGFRGAGRGR